MAEKKPKPSRPASAAPARELSKQTVWLLLGLMMLAGFFLRINGLTADAPRDLTWSLSPYTDEGFMVQNAKNKVLFGHWLLDDFFRMAVSPLFSVIMFVNFKLFGFGFSQARMVSVLFGLGTILLTFFILKREAGTKTGLLGSLLASTSFLWIMQNRLALEESTMMFFVLLSIFLWTLPARQNWQFLAAGLSASVAIFFVKLSGLFFAPVLVAEALRQKFLVSDSPLNEQGWKPFLLFAAGFLIGPIVWVLTIIIPFGYPARLMVKANTIESAGGKPEDIGVFIRNIVTLGTGDRLSARAPVVFLLACWGLLAWVGNIKNNLKEKNPLKFIIFTGFCTGTVMLALTNYHPLRYQMIFLLPTIFWASLKAVELWQEGLKPTQPTLSSLLLKAPLAILFSFNLLYTWYAFMLNNYPSFTGLVDTFSANPQAWFEGLLKTVQNYGKLLTQAVIVGIVGLGLWWWISSKLSKRPPVSIFPARVLVLVLLFFGIISDFSQYNRWSKNKTYQEVELSRDLRNLPPNSMVAGPWSSSATIEAPVRALPMQVYLHKEKVLERFPVTHLLIFQGGWEAKFFQESYPEVLNQSKVLKAYPVAGGTLYLLELPPKNS
ncbi:MAG: glycosyltransferase family 39 protein [candidate division Zixibacteria bacterium]|nr:glycosyltransferase family 39 protein [candidate division Zixibacteria bacterium]MCI0595570.1 glycosyltransferase family 39 protein [candidate division Zixibacteria bacterium]